MTGWTEFAFALIVFFVSHSQPLRPTVRARLTGWMGRGGFTVSYSILSLAALVWLVGAAGRAPYVELWPRLPWQTHVPLIAMALACLIAAFAVARPNPFSFGGGSEGFDPDRPGIVRWSRHPLLAAIALWSASHMVPNGDLAHVLLFGIFAGFAALGMRIVDRRKRRLLGGARWKAMWQAVTSSPVIPQPVSVAGMATRALAAIAAYVALLALHPLVIGVSPLP
ncbi:NnrU family protein [Paracoccus sediminicola]|uniref:NnrU family protein n=1 Tax=Paracoccus sediminicola TaxID=3017783 RepID=UPI0022F078A3|nr:NnrU family protein [Paracoccus sediminicola]WBU58745.1 NnrU family protein [Paracoccus sediminicola]